MKQLALILCIVFSLSVKSQINLSHTLNGSYYNLINRNGSSFYKFTTSSVGEKFCVQNSSDTSVTIYNPDWSSYRQVTFPNGYNYYPFPEYCNSPTTGYVSDQLFNSDTLLEFVCFKFTSSQSSWYISIINELGSIVYTFPDSVSVSEYSTTNSTLHFYELGGNYYCWYFTTNNEIKIYSLPGTLPCNSCNSLPNGIIDPNLGGVKSGFNVFPNPFSNSLSFQYDLQSPQTGSRIVITDILGQELKTISLAKQSDNLTIDATNLPRGTLIVSLYGSGANPISKKIIKIN